MAQARLLRSQMLWLGAFAVSASTVACGGSKQAPATAPTAPSVEPAQVLTEVPEPTDLVLVVRWANPEASAKTVSSYTGLPLSLSELTDKLPAWLSPLAAQDASVDFVLTLAEGKPTTEPSFHGAVAFGLRASVEEARRAAIAAGEPLEELGPGVYRLQNELTDLRCDLAAAAGPAPSRIVCGEDADDVSLLAPYLTRTLARQPAPANDLSAELRFVPFENRYGSTIQQAIRMGASVLPAQFHIGQPRFDRALTDAAHGLADEALALTHDLNTLFMGIDLEEQAAKSATSLNFRGAQSWTVNTLDDAGKRAAAAPALFWNLPVDATTASFGRGASSARFSGIRRTLSNLLDGWLTHEGVKPADRQALVELFSDEYATDAPTVSASGPYDPETRANIVGSEKSPKTAEIREALANAGWQIVGLETPAPKWAGALRKLVTAYNGPGVKKQIERGLRAIDVTMPAPEVKLSPVSKELPEGSLEVVITLHPDADTTKAKASKAAPSVRVHGFLMPDAGRTWLAVGADRASLIARLRAVQVNAPASETLAVRSGLDAFRSGAYSSAGFLTAASLLQSFETKAGEAFGLSGLDSNRILRATRHGGATPILFEGEVHREGSATRAAMKLDAPREAIEDIVAAVMQVAAGQLGSSMPSSP